MEATGECGKMMQERAECPGLDAKTLELVAIGASVGSGCDE
ncbi:MAG TPA: hypothetical protein VI298_02895 [Geobacteraceae bacterium]